MNLILDQIHCVRILIFVVMNNKKWCEEEIKWDGQTESGKESEKWVQPKRIYIDLYIKNLSEQLMISTWRYRSKLSIHGSNESVWNEMLSRINIQMCINQHQHTQPSTQIICVNFRSQHLFHIYFIFSLTLFIIFIFEAILLISARWMR